MYSWDVLLFDIVFLIIWLCMSLNRFNSSFLVFCLLLWFWILLKYQHPSICVSSIRFQNWIHFTPQFVRLKHPPGGMTFAPTASAPMRCVPPSRPRPLPRAWRGWCGRRFWELQAVWPPLDSWWFHCRHMKTNNCIYIYILIIQQPLSQELVDDKFIIISKKIQEICFVSSHLNTTSDTDAESASPASPWRARVASRGNAARSVAALGTMQATESSPPAKRTHRKGRINKAQGNQRLFLLMIELQIKMFVYYCCLVFLLLLVNCTHFFSSPGWGSPLLGGFQRRLRESLDQSVDRSQWQQPLPLWSALRGWRCHAVAIVVWLGISWSKLRISNTEN